MTKNGIKAPQFSPIIAKLKPLLTRRKEARWSGVLGLHSAARREAKWAATALQFRSTNPDNSTRSALVRSEPNKSDQRLDWQTSLKDSFPKRMRTSCTPYFRRCRTHLKDHIVLLPRGQDTVEAGGLIALHAANDNMRIKGGAGDIRSAKKRNPAKRTLGNKKHTSNQTFQAASLDAPKYKMNIETVAVMNSVTTDLLNGKIIVTLFRVSRAKNSAVTVSITKSDAGRLISSANKASIDLLGGVASLPNGVFNGSSYAQSGRETVKKSSNSVVPFATPLSALFYASAQLVVKNGRVQWHRVLAFVHALATRSAWRDLKGSMSSKVLHARVGALYREVEDGVFGPAQAGNDPRPTSAPRPAVAAGVLRVQLGPVRYGMTM